MFRNANYTMIWNTLDYPAIAFPVTFVNQDKDVKEHRDKFWTIEDEENYRACETRVSSYLIVTDLVRIHR